MQMLVSEKWNFTPKVNLVMCAIFGYGPFFFGYGLFWFDYVTLVKVRLDLVRLQITRVLGSSGNVV